MGQPDAGPAAAETAATATITATATPTVTATATPTATITVTPTITATATPTPTAALRVSPSQFGLAFVNAAESQSTPQRIQRGVSTGAVLDRFPLYWERIETAPAEYDWEPQDAAIRADEAQGLGVLAILLGTPSHYWPGARAQADDAQTDDAWKSLPIGGSFVRLAGQAQAQGGCNPGDGPPAPSGLWNPIFADGADAPGPGKTPNPDNPWARFVYSAVERYRPDGLAGTHVRHWEIWNEPDLCHFWSGSPQEYARLLKVAYLVIKQQDPEATVLWGGLAHFANPDFLPQMVDALRSDPMAEAYGGFFDAAASHQYSLSYLGYQYTARVRGALAGAGWAGKPIWITESGVPVCDDYPGPNCPSPWRATPEEQAAYIWQNMAYTRLAGGGPIFHFMLHDDCGNVVATNSPDGFGLFKNESSSYCSPANAEPRLAQSAFNLASRYFAGAEVAWADIVNGVGESAEDGMVRRVAFFHPETRQRRLLVWALGPESVTAWIPAAGLQARRIDLDGREMELFPVEGGYMLQLGGATNRNWPNDRGDYDIGIYGVPVLLIEEDVLPPTAQVDPLPEQSWPEVIVSWRAEDWGVGLESVELWVQVDGEAWQLWRKGLPGEGEAVYMGVPGQRLAFAAVGVDKLGQSPPELTAQAWTDVIEKPTHVEVRGHVFDPAGQPLAGSSVTIGDESAAADSSGTFTLTVPPGAWDIRVDGELRIRERVFEEDARLALLHSARPNAVENGAFEEGDAGWSMGGSSPLAFELQPGTQDHAAHLAVDFVANPGVPGEEGSNGGNSTLRQRIPVPTGRPYLAFAYRVMTEEPTPGHDKFEVIVAGDGQPADYVLTQDFSSEWQYRFVDLSRYPGQWVNLIFNVYETSPNRRTQAWIDLVTVSDVSPLAAPPPGVFLYLPTVQRR